jgi:polyisoprenoid-binding protein YceI
MFRVLAIGLVLCGVWLGPSGPALAAPSAGGLEHFAIVPDSSTASYKVAETFLNQNNRLVEAVGTTHAIQGQIAIDRAHPAQSVVGPIRVDLSTLQSDSGRRDYMIRQHWLESAQHPTAEFDSTAIRGLPVPYPDGQQAQVEVQGTLTVREVAKPVTFTGTVRLAGNTLTGTLSAVVEMTDFGFDPPSILGVLKAENQVTVTMQFVAARVQAPAQ